MAKRGRPRSYDRESVLQKATELFWTQGYSATSLDDLSSAMGMSRPSLYNAFGDKEGVYRAALEQFGGLMREGTEQTLSQAPTMRAALDSFYRSALDVYFSTDPPPGCFLMSTAPAVALTHSKVREDFGAVIDEIDRMLAKRFRMAKRQGELSSHLKPLAAARMAHAVLQSLALRARAGESRASLLKMARDATDQILAPVGRSVRNGA